MATTHKQIEQLLNEVYLNNRDRAIMDEFLDLVRSGQLRYQDLNIRKTPNWYIDSLVYHDLFLDEMAESDSDELHRALIVQGAKSEYYEKWKDSKNVLVRSALAGLGFFIDQYLNDKSNVVIMSALKHSPQYLPCYFRDESLFDDIYEYYMDDCNVRLDEFKLFLKVNAKRVAYKEKTVAVKIKDCINLKQQSYREPTTIEKTMTASQLYDSGSPIWASGLSLNNIHDAKWTEVLKKPTEEIHKYIEKHLRINIKMDNVNKRLKDRIKKRLNNASQ